MCGIIAIISKDHRGLYAFDRDVFEELLVVNSIRGSDSTGVFGVGMKNEVNIVKQAIDPQTFMKSPEYKNWANNVIHCNAVIGHNRKATTGVISSENAHPFKEGNIVLVHNGMVFGAKELNKEAEVDSHALCHAFSVKGAKEVLRDVIGAFALIWYDIKAKELYLWRNSDRPLSMIETKDKIYLASEYKMLDWILHRERRLASVIRSGILSENVLYTIKLSPFTMSEEPLAKKIVPFTHYNDWPTNKENTVPSEMAGDVAEEIPQWLAESEKRMKETVANEEGPTDAGRFSSSQLRLKYPFESRVLFSLENVKPWTDLPKKYEVSGTIFLPGNPPVKGMIYTNQGTSLKDIKSWRDSRKLIGTVHRVLGLRDGSLVIHLNNSKITIPDMVKVWNHQTFPRLEWELICNTEKCHKCLKPLDVKQPENSSVNEKQGKLGVYRAVCHECIKKAIPEDKRAFLLKAPVDAHSIKEMVIDALKGNTHGS